VCVVVWLKGRREERGKELKKETKICMAVWLNGRREKRKKGLKKQRKDGWMESSISLFGRFCCAITLCR